MHSQLRSLGQQLLQQKAKHCFWTRANTPDTRDLIKSEMFHPPVAIQIMHFGGLSCLATPLLVHMQFYSPVCANILIGDPFITLLELKPKMIETFITLLTPTCYQAVCDIPSDGSQTYQKDNTVDSESFRSQRDSRVILQS